MSIEITKIAKGASFFVAGTIGSYVLLKVMSPILYAIDDTTVKALGWFFVIVTMVLMTLIIGPVMIYQGITAEAEQ